MDDGKAFMCSCLKMLRLNAIINRWVGFMDSTCSMVIHYPYSYPIHCITITVTDNEVPAGNILFIKAID
jgi:hypothetical protein